MRCWFLGIVVACHSHEPPPSAEPPPTPSLPPELEAAWTGEAIEPRVVHTAPTAFPLGNDLTIATLTAHGWLGTRMKSVEGFIDEIVDEHGVIATGPSASLVVDGDVVYVVFEPADQPARVTRLDKRKLVPVTGEVGFHWAFGGVGIENDTRAGLKTQRWQTVAIDHDKSSVVETSDGPYATGATRLGNEVIVSTREHDPPASNEDKAAALIAAQNGHTMGLAGLVGQPRGWLLHVDAKGHVASKELFDAQTPSHVATTKSGWLVISTEGTAGHMFNDGVLLARAPNDPTLRVIARNIELGSKLIAAGDWACMYTMPGDARVVHCVDPVRRIHVTSEPLTDNIMLYGIELTPKPRLVLHHTWYREGYGKPAAEDTLEIALP